MLHVVVQLIFKIQNLVSVLYIEQYFVFIHHTVDQVYLYLAMYRVFVFVIGILMLVFDPSLPLTQSNGGN